jgi:inosine triphosphate pyrophosphatase
VFTDLVLITGNQLKADYLAKWVGRPVPHTKLDLDEIQSLDPKVVAEHKVRRAYELIKKPVLVEDVALTFTALGRLPGTFIKWFLEELELEGLCRLADGLKHRSAEASIVYALFDGKEIRYFEAAQKGSIAQTPSGTNGFGWNQIFIPEGTTITYGDMDEETYKEWNIRAHAVEKLNAYLKSVDKPA